MTMLMIITIVVIVIVVVLQHLFRLRVKALRVDRNILRSTEGKNGLKRSLIDVVLMLMYYINLYIYK